MFRGFRIPRPRWPRRFPAWLALFAQLATLVGLPLPAVSAKDTSKPFPCQHRACGCMSASDCWRSCCCFSPRERMEWVRSRGEDLPEELVAAVAQDEAECASEETPSCCSHGGSQTSCCSKKPAANKSCCSKKPEAKKKPAAAKPSGWILGVAAKKCRGIDDGMGSGELSDVPATPFVLRLMPTRIDVLTFRPQFAAALPLPLDAPPPRISL